MNETQSRSGYEGFSMKALFPEDPSRVSYLLASCEELADRLEIVVISDRVPSLGGLCRIRGEWRLYLNPDLEPEDALEIFARAFATFDLSDHFVLPALREEIDRYDKSA